MAFSGYQEATASLRASFGLSLPDVGYDHLGDDYLIQASGSTTAATNPPYYALEKSSQHWIQRGDDVLGHGSVRDASLLDSETLAHSEQSMHHYNEADVVRAAALYLLHPVNQALSVWEPTQFTFKCQSEQSQHRTRSDIVYFKSSLLNPNQPNQPITAYMNRFHVLEFKRRGVIRPSEFRGGVMRPETEEDPDTRLNWLRRHVFNVGGNQLIKTAFTGNSRVLMQQTAAYAVSYNTRYISLFDWDTLVLIYFDGLDISVRDAESRRENGVSERCHFSIITDKRLMRKALLGFIAMAWQQNGA